MNTYYLSSNFPYKKIYFTSTSTDKKSNWNQTGSQQSAKLDGLQRKLRQHNSPLKEARRKTSDGNEKLKNLDANSSKAKGKARKKASDQNGTPGTEKKMKRNLDKTRETVNQRVPSAKKEAKRKSYKQDEEHKDLMLEKRSLRSKPIKEQNKAKLRKQNETLNDDDPSSQSPEVTSLGKSQELSARRLRVMESLGLIAPPGSPFHKDGHIYNLSS